MSMRFDLDWHGPEVTARTHDAAAAGLGKAMEHLLGEARKVVPIEEATLERSGVASVDNEGLVGAVSFDTVYARRQHEELTWRHAPGRTAKYLEGPLNAERDTLLAIVAAQIRRATQ